MSMAAVSLLFVGSTHEHRAANRRTVEQMTDMEKAELARKQKRFDALNNEMRRKVCDLHDRLEADPDGESLRKVMRAYCDWLDAQSETAVQRLRKQPVEKRVEAIAKKRYVPQDRKAIRRWWWSYLEQRYSSKTKSRAKSPDGKARDSRYRKRAYQEMWPLWQRHKTKKDKEKYLLERIGLNKADLTSLRTQLSRGKREWFDKLSEEKQRAWVAQQVIELLRQEVRARFFAGRWRQVTDEQLAEIFESDSLTDEDRDSLMRLPGAEMRGRLQQLYYLEHGGPAPGRPGPRGDRPPRGHGPGFNRRRPGPSRDGDTSERGNRGPRGFDRDSRRRSDHPPWGGKRDKGARRAKSDSGKEPSREKPDGK
jgi:hypothetical protein